jgi:hypothetical protein
MNISDSETGQGPLGSLQNLKLRPSLAFGIIILTALIAFEIFNYSTTDYALRDLLGELKFAGMRWATILSIAFCGIDFAGIARLFTPQQGMDEPKEVWYLFGAWLLAATMNAILTWWGVSMAVTNHAAISSQTVVEVGTLTKVVPAFVAIMVWVIRILIIGSLSYAGDHLFYADGKRQSSATSTRRSLGNSATRSLPDYTPPVMAPRPVVNRSVGARPAQQQPQPSRRNTPPQPEPHNNRPEPTYHSLVGARSAAPRPLNHNNERRT